MVVLSRVFGSKINAANAFSRLFSNKQALKNGLQQIREMSGHHHHMEIKPSRFQWDKFKDMCHYYFMVGAIPVGAIIFYTNVFIGPATLTEIPPDYEPKHWEYHRHPISRFLARYLYSSPQQEYEKMCHAIFEEDEKMQMRKLEQQVKEKMKEYQDYEAYYYRPVTAKYLRFQKKVTENQEKNMLGD
ncbi:NADH dehydrogenase [ubiquinone] 1 beta subcomplex subunit 5, mitochondrial [Culicoides brevitarsis]|uniref:NADH dehydrogenase [ubiquinone] 1 beta subcomplex subunit 5, mitochondrial n=1 Tax=Culicoides brevitarsis TaxID=469753 RepID=UPI00307B61D5